MTLCIINGTPWKLITFCILKYKYEHFKSTDVIFPFSKTLFISLYKLFIFLSNSITQIF